MISRSGPLLGAASGCVPAWLVCQSPCCTEPQLYRWSKRLLTPLSDRAVSLTARAPLFPIPMLIAVHAALLLRAG